MIIWLNLLSGYHELRLHCVIIWKLTFSSTDGIIFNFFIELHKCLKVNFAIHSARLSWIQFHRTFIQKSWVHINVHWSTWKAFLVIIGNILSIIILFYIHFVNYFIVCFFFLLILLWFHCVTFARFELVGLIKLVLAKFFI